MASSAMEAVFEGRLQKLELQLRRYAGAYNAQRELLLQLHTQLQAAETADGAVLDRGGAGTVAHPERGEGRGAQMPAGVRGLLQEDAFRRRLTQLLRDPLGPPQEAATAAVATPSNMHSEDASDDDLWRRHGEVEDGAPQREVEEANWCASRRRGHDDEDCDDADDGGGVSQRASRLPAAERGATAVTAEQLTASLALTASDAAARFLEMMRRLWSAYFAHLHAEVRGALRGVDDAFACFDADPSEDTLVEFLEAHQQLQPLLRRILGIPETADAAAVLPPGNPFEPEGAVVQQLSLCIAEAVSPLLTVALCGGVGHEGAVLRQSLPEKQRGEPTQRKRLHEHRAHTAAATALPPFHPLRQSRHAWREERAGSHCGSSSDSDRRGSSGERPVHALDVTARGTANYEPSPPPLQPQRRQPNDSSQIEVALFSRSISSESFGNAGGVRGSVGAPAAAAAASTATGEDEMGDVALSKHPSTQLRSLRMQEGRLAFALINTAAQRLDHGCEAKCYAINKQLARVRSAILRTEREVNELQRIEEEKEALRKERAARQQRLLLH
ncbi:hypothetical protein TraAM80_04504 [Trypanosoma rangeli]|uniref:Uncharacterized protein n=1 Tax=Trypanosoma rangeli TaxID=5698 RepID=A0A422NJD2_TRYRA|nr:uncharacterized protein TraAM80_04504 [Trypanosoma rangeli]RNF05565.1 hypothetical protein TraAM80_04504 [Trypanosoma rangeli]|eukprot:RNF05565.1 hypothetical protein TraAM80_04504 [Trypanosoma rangeli]